MKEDWRIKYMPAEPMVVDNPLEFRGEWEQAIDYADSNHPQYPTCEVILEFGFAK